jgi:hypothetical protein
VVVGLYQLETMERLALVDKAGQRTADTSIVLGEPTGP